MNKAFFLILGIVAAGLAVGLWICTDNHDRAWFWENLVFLAAMMSPLAIILLAVGAHLVKDRRMSPEERARIVAEIHGRREAGLPRPRSPRKSLLLPAAVAAAVGSFLVLGLFAIGLTPLWFVFLPIVLSAAFLPFAIFTGSDRRPSPWGRGLVRGRPIDPWQDLNPGRGMQLVRFSTPPIDTGPLHPPPRRRR